MVSAILRASAALSVMVALADPGEAQFPVWLGTVAAEGRARYAPRLPHSLLACRHLGLTVLTGRVAELDSVLGRRHLFEVRARLMLPGDAPARVQSFLLSPLPRGLDVVLGGDVGLAGAVVSGWRSRLASNAEM